jgi:mono/diheme cytochrome c family protein
MRRAAVSAAVVLAAACVTEHARRTPVPATVGAPAPAVATGPDTGVTMFRDDCLACHTGDLVRQQRLTDKQWGKTLEKMRTWGAPTGDEGVQPLLAHLEAIGPVGAGPYRPQILSVDQAAELFARQPDGAFARGNAKSGETLYGDQCAPCHGDQAEGGAMGVALAGRHILDRALDLALVVRAGRGRMPAFESVTDTEIADEIAYLRSLSRAK